VGSPLLTNGHTAFVSYYLGHVAELVWHVSHVGHVKMGNSDGFESVTKYERSAALRNPVRVHTCCPCEFSLKEKFVVKPSLHLQ
jgi:hypothetical protein